MDRKESAGARFEFVREPRKSALERAILACWAPFSLLVVIFAALGVWALNLSAEEILGSSFWLPFIRAVRVSAPFLGEFAASGASLNVLAFYACAACFWLSFFAAVFCLNYGRADFARVNLIQLAATFALLGGFCFLAISGLLFAPAGTGGRWGVYVRFDNYALANESALYNLAVGLVVGIVFASFARTACDLICKIKEMKNERNFRNL